MTSGDWLPAQAPFDLVRRGYSPEQVTTHLERLEYDLRITTANRDATNQRLSEFSAQLAAAQSEADTLRAQLDRLALEPVSMSGLSDRMQRMIRLAEEEAADIRARAETEADRQRSHLEKALADAAEARSTFDTERERTRKQLAEQVHELIAEATAEAEETRAAAQAESTRLLQEANAEADHTVTEARRYAEQSMLEINQAVATVRAQAQQETDTLRAQTQEDTDRLLTEARETAATLTMESAAERARLDAEALAHRTQVQDDFEIAVAGRRAEAAKTIADRESSGRAIAEKLVADATARAEQLVADATAESELLMQQATTYANALVNRAAAESHRRVADADQALTELNDLRGRILDQLHSLAGHLDHIRDLAGSAPAIVAPPEQEATRPRADDFPADPTARPTAVPLPIPVLETGSRVPENSSANGDADRDHARAEANQAGSADNPAVDDAGHANARPDHAADDADGGPGNGKQLASASKLGHSIRHRTFGQGRNRG